jgi:hypothetical protein
VARVLKEIKPQGTQRKGILRRIIGRIIGTVYRFCANISLLFDGDISTLNNRLCRKLLC